MPEGEPIIQHVPIFREEKKAIDKSFEKEQNIPEGTAPKEATLPEGEARGAEIQGELSAEEREQIEREVFNLENQIKPEVKMLWNRKEPEMKLGVFGRLAKCKSAFIGFSFASLLAISAERAESQQLPPSVWGRDTVVYEPSGRSASTAGRSSGGAFESGDLTACSAGFVGTFINALAGERNPARPIERCIDASVRNRQTYERSRQDIIRQEARRLEQERRSQEREEVARIRKEQALGVSQIRKETVIGAAEIGAAARTGTYIPRRGGSVETQETATGASSTVRPELESRYETTEADRGRRRAREDHGDMGKPTSFLSSYSEVFQQAYKQEWLSLTGRALL